MSSTVESFVPLEECDTDDIAVSTTHVGGFYSRVMSSVVIVDETGERGLVCVSFEITDKIHRRLDAISAEKSLYPWNESPLYASCNALWSTITKVERDPWRAKYEM